jgi:hypothetical protein
MYKLSVEKKGYRIDGEIQDDAPLAAWKHMLENMIWRINKHFKISNTNLLKEENKNN